MTLEFELTLRHLANMSEPGPWLILSKNKGRTVTVMLDNDELVRWGYTEEDILAVVTIDLPDPC